jgi:hypothetical protein
MIRSDLKLHRPECLSFNRLVFAIRALALKRPGP